jgi:hypothetical protein
VRALMPVYHFDEQNLRGGKGESFLDSFFAERGHYIQKATRGQQRVGIDRVFLKDGGALQVEYKTDLLAHRTGKAFVETISSDSSGKQGWAYTSRADVIVYFIPGLSVIFVVPPARLREQLERWQQAYPTRSAPNQDYATHGILVPIEEFERQASQVFHLPPDAFDGLTRQPR